MRRFRRVAIESTTLDENRHLKIGVNNDHFKSVQQAYWKTADLTGPSGVFRQPEPPYHAGDRAAHAAARCCEVWGAQGTFLAPNRRPPSGPDSGTPAKEATRQAVNSSLRSSHEFDGVLDFDKVVRDPAHPSQLNPALDSGDHIHPNEAGYQAIINDYGVNQLDFAGNRVASMHLNGAGHGVSEAPRGVLYHRYEIDQAGNVASARIIPPTSQNQAAIQDDLRGFVAARLDLDDEALTHSCEQAIRNYDPCISCATHFLDLRVDRR